MLSAAEWERFLCRLDGLTSSRVALASFMTAAVP